MLIRVLNVDDSSFFRRWNTAILEADPAIEATGFATDGNEAIRTVREQQPDVVTAAVVKAGLADQVKNLNDIDIRLGKSL